MEFVFERDKKDFRCPLCGGERPYLDRTMSHMWKFGSANANNKKCNKKARKLVLSPKFFNSGEKSDMAVDILNVEYPSIDWKNVQQLVIGQEWKKLTKKPFNMTISEKDMQYLLNASHENDNGSSMNGKTNPSGNIKRTFGRSRANKRISESETDFDENDGNENENDKNEIDMSRKEKRRRKERSNDNDNENENDSDASGSSSDSGSIERSSESSESSNGSEPCLKRRKIGNGNRVFNDGKLLPFDGSSLILRQLASSFPDLLTTRDKIKCDENNENSNERSILGTSMSANKIKDKSKSKSKGKPKQDEAKRRQKFQIGIACQACKQMVNPCDLMMECIECEQDDYESRLKMANMNDDKSDKIEMSQIYVCMNCYTYGIESIEHRRFHYMHAVPPLQHSIFERSWIASEEICLLQSIQRFGICNWESCAQYINNHSNSKNHKTAAQVKQHFIKYYCNNENGCYLSSFLDENENDKEKKGRRKSTSLSSNANNTRRPRSRGRNNENEKSETPKYGKSESLGNIDNESTVSTVKTKLKKGRMKKNKKSNLSISHTMPLLSQKINNDNNSNNNKNNDNNNNNNNNGDSNNNNNNNGGKNGKHDAFPPHIQQKVSYNSARGEFEATWNNEAEGMIADIEFTEYDHPSERALKFEALRLYNKVLVEREKREQFILQYGVNYAKNYYIPHNVGVIKGVKPKNGNDNNNGKSNSNDSNEKDIAWLDTMNQITDDMRLKLLKQEMFENMAPFALYAENKKEFNQLIDGLVDEKHLREEIYKEKHYLLNGIDSIDTMNDIETFYQSQLSLKNCLLNENGGNNSNVVMSSEMIEGLAAMDLDGLSVNSDDSDDDDDDTDSGSDSDSNDSNDSDDSSERDNSDASENESSKIGNGQRRNVRGKENGKGKRKGKEREMNERIKQLTEMYGAKKTRMSSRTRHSAITAVKNRQNTNIMAELEANRMLKTYHGCNLESISKYVNLKQQTRDTNSRSNRANRARLKRRDNNCNENKNENENDNSNDNENDNSNDNENDNENENKVTMDDLAKMQGYDKLNEASRRACVILGIKPMDYLCIERELTKRTLAHGLLKRGKIPQMIHVNIKDRNNVAQSTCMTLGLIEPMLLCDRLTPIDAPVQNSRKNARKMKTTPRSSRR